MVIREQYCRSKYHDEVIRCSGYRKNNCYGCSQVLTELVHHCDRCEIRLDEYNPPHDFEGQEYCESCLKELHVMKGGDMNAVR